MLTDWRHRGDKPERQRDYYTGVGRWVASVQVGTERTPGGHWVPTFTYVVLRDNGPGKEADCEGAFDCFYTAQVEAAKRNGEIDA